MSSSPHERNLLPQPGTNTRAPRLTEERFSTGFERCFERVYAYVSRRVSDRKSCERIVGEVLAENLDVLVEVGDEKWEFSRLKASLDRWIGWEPATSLVDGTSGS